MGKCHEEGYDEPAADEHGQVGGEGVDDGAHADSQEAEEHVVFATIPVCQPDEECAAHQADLIFDMPLVSDQERTREGSRMRSGQCVLTWKMAKVIPVLAFPLAGRPKYLV